MRWRMDSRQNISSITTCSSVTDSSSTVPQIYLRISNLLSAIVACVSVFHLVFLAIKPRSKRPRAENFKITLIFVAVCDVLNLAERLVVDHLVIQKALCNYHWLCLFTATIHHSVSSFQFFLFFVMSLECMVTLCYPVKYSLPINRKKLIVVLLSVLAVILVFFTCLAGVFYKHPYSVRGFGVCILGNSQMPMLHEISAILALMFLASLTVTSLMAIRKIHSLGIAANDSMLCTRTSPLRHTRIAFTIAILASTKILCWMPSFVAIIVSRISMTPSYSTLLLDYFAKLTLTTIPISTPLIYIYSSKEHRQFIIKTLTSSKVAPDSEMRQHVVAPAHLETESL